MSKTRLVTFAVVIPLFLTLAACIKRVEMSTPANSVGAAIALEQFLTAANATDLTRMATLFGTKDGPTTNRDPKDLVEKQMFVFANVLRHEDYKIENEQIVPGRRDSAIQLNVGLTNKGKKVIIPFTMVRATGDRWMVEQFDLQKLLSQR
jgi:sporulation protein YlmC with PRC-barrel domain